MKYAVETGSGTMIWICRFIKIGSTTQHLIERKLIQTHKQQGDLISLLLFFKIREVCQKRRQSDMYTFLSGTMMLTSQSLSAGSF
jgi:hypothetical protein